MKWRKGWERQTEWWKKQGLKNKILLICIPGAIFSSVIIMVLASFIFREYEKNMYNITVQNLNMIIRHIEMELQEADDTSVEIITDATVQSALSPGKPNVRSWEVSMDYIRQLRALYEVLCGLAGILCPFPFLWMMSGTMWEPADVPTTGADWRKCGKAWRKTAVKSPGM